MIINLTSTDTQDSPGSSEGEKDDTCAIGQTVAAQDLCSSLRPQRKTHHVQTGVGHYGVFSGKRWENEIYPIVRNAIHMSS